MLKSLGYVNVKTDPSVGQVLSMYEKQKTMISKALTTDKKQGNASKDKIAFVKNIMTAGAISRIQL